MKLITVLLIATMMQVSAASFAQKLTLKKDNISLEQLFKEIRKQTGYAVIYTAATIKDSKAINADFQNTPIEEVLTTSLKNQNLKFEIDTRNIIITKAPPTFLDRLAERWANRDIRGRVVDEKGNPLPNASIRITGKSMVITTTTNQKGEFYMKDVADDAVLVVSYVGYKQLKISLNEVTIPLEIKLNMQTGELEEVKVTYNTGYQELDLKKATGSVVQIDNELFNRQVGKNVLDRIYNVTSGLINGSGAGFEIRGQSTINADKKPLIVVDNFPYEGDLNFLNPNDVESITVLKDAAAAAIWGVRAGNGVIVINTKKGKLNQATEVSSVNNVTIVEKPNLFYIPYLSSKEMIEFEKEQFSTGKYNVRDDIYPQYGIVNPLPESIEILLAGRKQNKHIPGYNATNDPIVLSKLDQIAQYDIRNDIDKYLLRNSINQQYAFNLRGGGDKYTYYVSGGYDHNKGQNVKDINNRLSFILNNTFKPVKQIEVYSSLVHTRVNNNATQSSFSQFLPGNNMSLYTRLVDEQGNPMAVTRFHRPGYLDTVSFNGLLDWRYRPLSELDYDINSSKYIDTRMLAGIKYMIVNGLDVEFQYQNQLSQNNNKRYEKQESYLIRDAINKSIYRDITGNIVSPYPIGDRVTMMQAEFNAWNLRGTINFKKTWKEHSVTAFGGMEIRETTSETNSNRLYGFDPNTNTHQPVSYTVNIPVLRPANSTVPVGELIKPISLLTRYGSRYANAVYSFKSRYLFSASGRIDESNFFGLKANLRRTPLWSIGLAWNLHLEDFYKISWLSQLKLKLSYGYTGNTNAGATSFATFRYLSPSDEYSLPRRDAVYGKLVTGANPSLSWERVKIVNLGLDFSIAQERIYGSIEYYLKNGLDLLGPIAIEPTLGLSNFIGNYASMKGNGWDFSINTKNITGRFQWRTSITYSMNKGRIVKYADLYSAENAGQLIQGGVPKLNVPMNSLHSYRYMGLNPLNGNPQILLGDTTSNYLNYSKAKLEDLVYSGQTNPKVFGSFLNEFKYKSVAVSANIIFRFGHVFRKPTINYYNMINGGWTAHSDYNLRWRQPGDEQKTSIPSFPQNDYDFARDYVYGYSDVLVEKADHIRLQDIRLSYSFNRNVFKLLPIRSATLYLYAQNLGIIWSANKQGIDPDAYAFGSTPTPKSIAFGMNVNF